MSTTLIFAEFLSIGALTLIGIGLIAVGVGVDPEVLRAWAGNGPTVGLMVALAVAYPLGITIDGCADRLFRFVGDRTKGARGGLLAHQTVFALACDKTRWSEFAGKYFEYNRIKTRLARSFILNSIILSLAGGAAGLRLHWGNHIVIAWFLLWLLLAAGAYWTLKELRENAQRKLFEAWNASDNAGAKNV